MHTVFLNTVVLKKKNLFKIGFSLLWLCIFFFFFLEE